MDENGRSIVTLAMLSHAIVHTYELSIPILVVVWLAEFSVTTALVGTVVAVGYALFGIGALPSGVLTDRYSAKWLIVLGLLGMGASFLLLSTAGGIVSIALALCVWGIAASIHHPAALALISTGVRQRGTGFAYHGMAGNVGIAFGPLVTALLLLALEWRVVAALLVVPVVVAAGYALTVDVEEMAAEDGDRKDQSREPASRSFLADSRSLFTAGFALALAVVVANGLFYRGTLTFLPGVLGDVLPPVVERFDLFDPGSPLAREFDLASYVYAGLLTVGIAGQYVGGKLTDRIRVTTGLAAGFAGLVVVAVVFVPVASAGLGPALAIAATFGFLLFALQPLYQATIAEHSPPGERGLSYGYTYLANFGVGAAGAAIAGSLLSIAAPGGTFAALATIPAVGGGLAVLLSRIGAPARVDRSKS
ncbi:MAG: MFS transporter [Haloferacaceae archaeon]